MNPLTTAQLDNLTVLFHAGAADASTALSRWLVRDASVQIDSIEQLSMAEATSLLGASDVPWCACVMGVEGFLTGKMLFCFDDASGLQLCRYLIDESLDAIDDVRDGDDDPMQWSELGTSAALETANIVGSAYVSSLAESMSSGPLVPTPPIFVREYAASLIEFAIMDQMAISDQVLFTRTQFYIDGTPILWSLLLIPDATSLEVLSNWLRLPGRIGKELS